MPSTDNDYAVNDPSENQQPQTTDRKAWDYGANKLVYLSDFAEYEFPDTLGYWGKTILAPGFVTFLAGRSKLGKTLLAFDLALHLAKGEDFLGFPIPEPISVCYIQAEVCQVSFQERVHRMCGTDGLPPKESFSYTRAYNACIDRNSVLAKLIEEAFQKYHAKVIVVDPLRPFHGCEENSSTEMSLITNFFDAWRMKYNLAFLIVHHTRKESLDGIDTTGDEMRGSNVLEGFADNILMMKGPQNASRFNIRFTLRHEEGILSLPVIRDKITLRHSLGGPVKYKVGSLEEVQVALAELKGQAKQSDLVDVLLKKYKWGRDAAYRRIREAEKYKVLRRKEVENVMIVTLARK